VVLVRVSASSAPQPPGQAIAEPGRCARLLQGSVREVGDAVESLRRTKGTGWEWRKRVGRVFGAGRTGWRGDVVREQSGWAGCVREVLLAMCGRAGGCASRAVSAALGDGVSRERV
jgi:hypothetical protein